MTEPSDDSIDAGTEEWIRRLLADARRDEPMPRAIADRLDGVLADLSRERAQPASEAAAATEEGEPDSAVVPFRRRGRTRRLLLASAAAVVLLGGGGVAVSTFLQTGQPASESAGAPSGSTPTSAASPGESGKDDGTRPAAKASAATPELSRAHFARDVRRLLHQERSRPGPASPTYPATCPGPRRTDPSTTRPARLDGERVALVVARHHGAHTVTAWSCDGMRQLATTVVR